jgi:Ca2+-binding RTX toxin-like protein
MFGIIDLMRDQLNQDGLNYYGNYKADDVSMDSRPNLIYGYVGNDKLSSGDGKDTIYAGDGNDSVNAGEGDDLIWGDEGNDTIDGGIGSDVIDGGQGLDVTVFSGGIKDYSFDYDANTSTYAVTHNYSGYFNANTSDKGSIDNITAVEYLQFYEGRAYVLSGKYSDYTISSFKSEYTLNFTYVITDSIAESEVSIYSEDVKYFLFTDGFKYADESFTNVYGGNNSDYLEGCVLDNVIYGYAGNDTITGNEGNDTIFGGDGVDMVSFRGYYADYIVKYDAITSSYTVTDIKPYMDEYSEGDGDAYKQDEGIDTIIGVEFVHFVDGTLKLSWGN